MSETELPSADVATALERLRIEMRHLKDEMREFREADRERAKASRSLIIAVVIGFLTPTVGAVWGYAQLSARVEYLIAALGDVSKKHDEHEMRNRSIEMQPAREAIR